MFARGSRITDLVRVKLRHCVWSLGTARSKHFAGGKNKVKIVIIRKHQGTRGSVRFTVVDAAGQKKLVKRGV